MAKYIDEFRRDAFLMTATSDSILPQLSSNMGVVLSTLKQSVE